MPNQSAAPIPSGHGHPLSLAFISPYNLFDAGSGAAQSVRTMLEQMAVRGATCRALTACCFDAAPGDALAATLRGKGLSPSAKVDAFSLPVWQGSLHGVGYDVVQTPTQQRDKMTAIEELAYRDVVRGWLAVHRPDVVITYGGLLLDIEIQRCIRAAGAALVFYLPNPGYGRRETFAQVDAVLTNSGATADHYARSMGLHCHNVGVFVDDQAILASKHSQEERQFVCFINPLPEKGVALFLKLVERAAREAPGMRFLVVESRGLLAPAMQKLGFAPALLERIKVLPKQEQMAPVYAATRILLVPSFWFEAAGRVLIEANANGIPVLAARRGGIPETLGNAGCLLSVPERCTTDFWALPTDEEVQPWWEELIKLWQDAVYCERMAERALAAAATQTLQVKADKLASLLSVIVANKRQQGS